MKALLIGMALLAGLSGPAASASWGYPGLELQAQGPRDRHGGEGAQDRAQQRGREVRPERRAERAERPERLNDDERRALHRDLEKANRELYQRRFEK